jgi:hypothetical protein
MTRSYKKPILIKRQQLAKITALIPISTAKAL